MESSGVTFEERQESVSMAKYSIEQGWIKFFYDKQHQRIGFITWIVEEHPEGNFILITNFYKQNGKLNILSLRKYFKDRFSPISKVQWNNNKTDMSVIRTPFGGEYGQVRDSNNSRPLSGL